MGYCPPEECASLEDIITPRHDGPDGDPTALCHFSEEGKESPFLTWMFISHLYRFKSSVFLYRETFNSLDGLEMYPILRMAPLSWLSVPPRLRGRYSLGLKSLHVLFNSDSAVFKRHAGQRRTVHFAKLSIDIYNIPKV